MHSIITKEGDYIGQFLYLKNNEYCIRMFTKIYNLSVKDERFFIDNNQTRDLIIMNKYNFQNNINATDVITGEPILKPLKLGSCIVFINETAKLYILSKYEFKKFLKDNKYKKDVSNNFVLATQKDNIFNNVDVITTNNITNARKIYYKKHCIENPIFLGIEDDNFLYMPIEDTIITTKIFENKHFVRFHKV